MILSLIICTRNRSLPLQQALLAFEKLEIGAEWELILVNNGSTDTTADVLLAFAENSRHQVVLVEEPRPGLSRARNRGLSFAKGDVVTFTDDDCYPQSDFLNAVLARFEDPSVDFFGGRVLLHDQTDLRMTIQELDEETAIEPFTYMRTGLIHGANMAFRRSALLAIGGFDERLGAGAPFKAAEDTDALIRCVEAGYRGFYDPAAVVFHHHGRKTPADAVALRKNYAIGRGACMTKHCLHPDTRDEYARRWYWHLRGQKNSTRLRELWAGVRFICRYGVLPSRVYPHIHESLSISVGEMSR